MAGGSLELETKVCRGQPISSELSGAPISFQQQDSSRLWAGKGFIISAWCEKPSDVSTQPYLAFTNSRFSVIKPHCSGSQPARSLLQVSHFPIAPYEIYLHCLSKPVLAGAVTDGTLPLPSPGQSCFLGPLSMFHKGQQPWH